MANTAQEFEQVFLTYKDVREANPDWTEQMIEDYLSLKRDLLLTADTGDATTSENTGSDLLALALAVDLRRDVGSGDALTWDETGFDWSQTNLTFDQDEA